MNYCFGDKIFEIESVFPYFHNFAKEYCVEEKAEIIISNKENEIIQWKRNHDDCKGFPLEYIETLVIHAKIAEKLAKYNTFILHGSTIGFDSLDNCYAFVAPSGTGKSTHVKILQKLYGSRILLINDDKPFIEINDKCKVYGSPWNGKEHLSKNIVGKLKGIFVVNRSKENSVERISSKEAIDKLIYQFYLPKGIEESTYALKSLIRLSTNIPVYLLNVNMNDEAALMSSKIMMK